MREGITNKGEGYRAARWGQKQERGKHTNINEHLNAPEKGHREVGL